MAKRLMKTPPTKVQFFVLAPRTPQARNIIEEHGSYWVTPTNWEDREDSYVMRPAGKTIHLIWVDKERDNEYTLLAKGSEARKLYEKRNG